MLTLALIVLMFSTNMFCQELFLKKVFGLENFKSVTNLAAKLQPTNFTADEAIEKLLENIDESQLTESREPRLGFDNGCQSPSCYILGSDGQDTSQTGGNVRLLKIKSRFFILLFKGGLGTYSNGCPSSHPCKFGFKCCPQFLYRKRKVCNQSYCPNPVNPS